VLEQDEIRRRIRAAMALAGVRGWDDLAARTPMSRSTVKDLGTRRGHADESHLRVIAAACGLPYAWFTVADLGRAVEREDEDPSLAERVEALEGVVAALVRREAPPTPASAAPPGEAGSPPTPPGALGRRLQAHRPTPGDPPQPDSAPEEGSPPRSGG
jgi:hypothetical protein